MHWLERYRPEHREAVKAARKEARRKWCEKNRERVREYDRKWRAANQEHYREYHRLRRLKKKERADD